MNSVFFLDKCHEAFGKKDLSSVQVAIYSEKLRRFEGEGLHRIYDWLLENCKFFPKIADAFEAARSLGILSVQQQWKPHVWEPTDCRLCAGSGMVAAWYAQEYEERPHGAVEILRLVALEPYHVSLGMPVRPSHDSRVFFRCECGAGASPSGMTGLPRWNKVTSPAYRERSLGS